MTLYIHILIDFYFLFFIFFYFFFFFLKIISALKGKDDFLDVMLDRIETTHVVDLLVKLIATDDAEVGTIEV